MKLNKVAAIPVLALAAGLSLAACGSSGSPSNGSSSLTSAGLALANQTLANDGYTQCDPSTAQSWGDGSVSASCNDTLSDGSTATQTPDLLGSIITIS